ncbi:MAG: radical SAM protein, partial [bacterium]
VPTDDLVRKQLDTYSNCERVIFTHGEPTLNPDLLERIKYAKKLGFPYICLVTNGRLLSDKELCRKLVEAGLNDITISLHGHIAEIHDTLTTVKGSFEHSFQAVQNFAELRDDYKVDLYISTVLNKINLPYVYDMLSTFISLDIDKATFKHPRIHGRSLKNFDRVVPTLSEIAKAFKDAIDNLSKQHPMSVIISLVTLCGTPYCLMSGYEMFVQRDEIVLGLDKDSTKLTRIESMESICMRKECSECVYITICPGVEVEYIKYFGWDDYKPCEEYSPAFQEFLKMPEYVDLRDKIKWQTFSEDEKANMLREIDDIIAVLRSGNDLSADEKANMCFDVGNKYLMLNKPHKALKFLDYTTKYIPRHRGAQLKKAMALIALNKIVPAKCALREAERCMLDTQSVKELNELKILLEEV